MISNYKRILIVDDEEQITFVLRNSLKRLSGRYEIEVVTARNGQEALQKLRTTPFDLIITDLKMHGVDGIALTEAAYAIVPGTKVIWITAYNQWESDARRLGVYRYLLKPVDMDEIRQVVREALETMMRAQGTRKAILLVDDEPMEALALYQALDYSAHGEYHIKISLVPEEALGSLKSEYFDLVIANLHTSEQDNLDLIRQVRRMAPAAQTLWLVNQCSPESDEQARQLATVCMIGTFDAEGLPGIVRQILGKC